MLQGLLFHCLVFTASSHSVVFTLPLQMFSWHKEMSLLYAKRGGIRNLPTLSPSEYLLQILFLFHTKSGTRNLVMHKNPTVQVSRSILNPSAATPVLALDAGNLSAIGPRLIPESKAISLSHWVWALSCLFSSVSLQLGILRQK